MRKRPSEPSRPRTFVPVLAALLALALLVPPQAKADASLRILSDPAFLPTQGQIQGVSTLIFNGTDEQLQNYLQLISQNRTFSSTQWGQTLAYGLTDDLTVRVGEILLWQQESVAPAFGPTQAYFNTGPEDPTLGGTWRVLDQGPAPLNWDWILSYAPDLVENLASSTTRVGSNGRGGQGVTLESAASHVGRDFTFYGDLAGSYFGQRDIVTGNDSIEQLGGYFQAALGLSMQARFTDRISFNATVTGYWVPDSSAVNLSSGLADTQQGGDEIALNAALNGEILPGRLVLALTYADDAYSSRSDTYPSAPKDNTTTTNDVTNSYGIRLEYLFR